MTPTQGSTPVNKWLIALTVMLPTFIEVMDTSVINVSLPHIQGSLNAGRDEVTWVLTSYLVANAIIIPITGWLARVFGRKRYLLFSIFVFTLSSLASGAAPSLAALILARIFQGLGGGGLQPLSQAILLESFPTEEHGMAMAVFGMGVVLAPVLGPVVGGWITDHLTWRWVFYINLPVGILAILLTTLFIRDPHYLRKAAARIDGWGLGLLAIGLGSLQIVLDKGQRDDWFSSHFIVAFTLIAGVALLALVIVELSVEHPVIDLRIFRNRSFTTGTLIMFCGFFSLFGSMVMIPLYLQDLMGYTALWAGLVLGPGGIASFFVMPMAGFLMKRGVNPRNLLAIGLTITAYALYLMSGFNLQADFMAIALPRLVQGFGLGLFFVPLTAATYVTIPKEEIGNATGIFNLLRNLGGSFGVAFSATVLARRAQLHQVFLTEKVNSYNSIFQAHNQRIFSYLKIHRPFLANSKAALLVTYQEVIRQALMLAYNDTFFILALLTIVLVPLTVIFRRPAANA